MECHRLPVSVRKSLEAGRIIPGWRTSRRGFSIALQSRLSDKWLSPFKSLTPADRALWGKEIALAQGEPIETTMLLRLPWPGSHPFVFPLGTFLSHRYRFQSCDPDPKRRASARSLPRLSFDDVYPKLQSRRRICSRYTVSRRRALMPFQQTPSSPAQNAQASPWPVPASRRGCQTPAGSLTWPVPPTPRPEEPRSHARRKADRPAC
jgi:hypothetical protein